MRNIIASVNFFLFVVQNTSPLTSSCILTAKSPIELEIILHSNIEIWSDQKTRSGGTATDPQGVDPVAFKLLGIAVLIQAVALLVHCCGVYLVKEIPQACGRRDMN